MIEDGYYTVDQISEMLNMHPKTIQRYIREGKLRACKIGKGWRIAGHDLSVFAENHMNTDMEGTGTSAEDSVKISSVIDIDVRSKEEAERIVNTLTAVLNAKPPEYGVSSMNAQIIEAERKVRVMLWGGLAFTEAILKNIEALTDREGLMS